MRIVDEDRGIFYQLLNLVYLTRKITPTVIEVGVCKGENALIMKNILKPKEMYLIDNWSTEASDDYKKFNAHRDWVNQIEHYSYYFGGDMNRQATFDNLFEEAKSKFAGLNNIHFIRENSLNGAFELKKLGVEKAELIYIDASHQFERVLDDLLAYRPFIHEENGCFQLNDCCFSEAGNLQNLGVLEAVVRFCKMENFVPVCLVNRDWTDILLAPKYSPITKYLDVVIDQSGLSFVELPNSLLGNLSIVGSSRPNISFCSF